MFEEAGAVVSVSDVLTAQMVEWSLLRYCHQLGYEGGVCAEAACVPLYACTLSVGSYVRNQHVSGSLTFLVSDSIPGLMQGELVMS